MFYFICAFTFVSSVPTVLEAAGTIDVAVWGDDAAQNVIDLTNGWQQIDSIPRPERLAEDPGYLLGRLVSAHAPILGSWGQIESAGLDDVEHTQANLAHMLFMSLTDSRERLGALAGQSLNSVRAAMVSLLILRQRQESPNRDIYYPYATPLQDDRSYRDEYNRGARNLGVALPDGTVVPVMVEAAGSGSYAAGSGRQKQGVLVIGLDRLLTARAGIARDRGSSLFQDIWTLDDTRTRQLTVMNRTAAMLAREVMGGRVRPEELNFLGRLSATIIEQLVDYRMVPDTRDQ